MPSRLRHITDYLIIYVLKPKALFVIVLTLNVLLPLLAIAESPHQKNEKGTVVPILIYHEILSGHHGNEYKRPGETIISLKKFSQQMTYLYQQGYTTLNIEELVNFMKGKRVIPPKSVVITFDDGWKSQMLALPILRQYHFKASFWLFPGSGIQDPYGDYLSWREVRKIANVPGFEIGAHSMTHPDDPRSNLVTWVDGKTKGRSALNAEYEIRQSKKVLETKLHRSIKYFAWPHGWYNNKLLQMAKAAHYEAVLTASDGANRQGDDVFHSKRIFVDGACSLEDFKETLHSYKYRICQTHEPPTLGHLPYASKQGSLPKH
ncbi:MAG: polysaccharide deacetylase family protein [Brasilonema angustatum HA4187-MV1]|jgi:peptidoglycan/xylan/chitin deacetylase (PgdA/CDA1 family)|nr:polysaccharide deacetylase family protein [Brasilonema angustatum HA4187-MV1]